jgi:ComF family protein
MKIITFIIDTLFPLRKDERVVRDTDETMVKSLFSPHHAQDCLCLSSYKYPLIRALITENKFYGNKNASRLLSVLLLQFISSRSEKIIFIPVPLGKARERDRGYNQVIAVLQQLPSSSQFSISVNTCSRVRETKPQVSLSRQERLSNITHAFVADETKLAEFKNCTVVIIDDVCTTGATLKNLKHAVAKHLDPSCKVICLALAH